MQSEIQPRLIRLGMPPDTLAWTLIALMLRLVHIWLKFQLVSKESRLTGLTWTRGLKI